MCFCAGPALGMVRAYDIQRIAASTLRVHEGSGLDDREHLITDCVACRGDAVRQHGFLETAVGCHGLRVRGPYQPEPTLGIQDEIQPFSIDPGCGSTDAGDVSMAIPIVGLEDGNMGACYIGASLAVHCCERHDACLFQGTQVAVRTLSLAESRLSAILLRFCNAIWMLLQVFCESYFWRPEGIRRPLF